MSANVYKRLSVSDTFVVPYTANKSWDISSGSFADHRIVVNLGVSLDEFAADISAILDTKLKNL